MCMVHLLPLLSKALGNIKHKGSLLLKALVTELGICLSKIRRDKRTMRVCLCNSNH